MKIFKKRTIVIIAVLLSLQFLTACTSPPQNEEGPLVQHLNTSIKSEVTSLDPAKISNPDELLLANAVFEGLVRLKADGTYEGAMADRWEIEEEGNKYIFHIREEALWSNGEKVTAHDFEYAWKRVLAPGQDSLYAFMLYDIKNSEGYNRSEENGFNKSKIDKDQVGIKAEDEATLVVELNKPNPAFIKKLVHPVFLPVPHQRAESSQSLDYDVNEIMGNGPFLIKSYETGMQIVLEKNRKYWDENTVKLEGMTWFITANPQEDWQQFNAGQLHLSLNIPQDILSQGNKDESISFSPLLGNYYYHINITQEPLDDIGVRKALSLSLDRGLLVTQKLQGGQKPAGGLVPAGMSDFEPGSDFRTLGGNMLVENIEEAQNLLAEAGYPQGKDFPQLKILVNGQESHQYFADLLKEQWKNNLGIEVSVETVPWNEMTEKTRERKFDIALQGWYADYADPLAFLERYVFGKGSNDVGWRNPSFDALIASARNTSEERERMDALHRAEKLLLNEMPVIPVFEYTRAYLAHGRLKGLFLRPIGAPADFKWAYFE